MASRVAVTGLLALAACYQPHPDAACTVRCGAGLVCPSNLECDGAMCAAPGERCETSRDAAIDSVVVDGSTPVTCATSTFAPPTQVVGAASSYVIYGEVEGYVDDSGNIRIHPFGPDPAFGPQYAEPRVTPVGDEVFVHASTGRTTLMRSTYTATTGTWAGPIALTVTGLPLSVDFSIGTVSTTATRQMAIATTENKLYLGDESVDAWEFTEITIANPFMRVQDPSISLDGLRIVFVAQPLAGARQIYIATRSTVTAAFTGFTPLYDSGSDEVTPFLSDDCSALYYSVAGTTLTFRSDVVN